MILVAEEVVVRLALHPNDRPAPLSCSFEQIMEILKGWKN